MLCRLAASPCQRRSKTQLLTNVSYAAEQLFSLDQAGLGGQCIVPSTVNLGLTIHTGWTCQLTNETMVKIPLQLSLTTLLSKQLVKFRTRLAAANRVNLSIHMKIIYFNTFSLSLFYYSQTQRFFFAQASQAAVPRNGRFSATATLVPATPIGWALQVVTHRPTA